MAQWYVIRGDHERGPFDDAQLKELTASGKLKFNDMIRREDATTPRPATTIKGLFHTSSTHPSHQTLRALPVTGAPSLRSFSRYLDRPALIVLMFIICCPFGLWLLWRNPRRSQNNKRLWTAVFLGVCCALILLGENAARRQIEQESSDILKATPIPAPVDDVNKSVEQVIKNDVFAEKEADNSKPKKRDDPVVSIPVANEIVELKDEVGRVRLYSHKPIPALYGIPQSIVKQMPTEQLDLLRATDKLTEEAYKLTEKAYFSTTVNGGSPGDDLKHQMNKDIAILSESLTSKWRRDVNGSQAKIPLKGWLGRIRQRSYKRLICIGNLNTHEGYGESTNGYEYLSNPERSLLTFHIDMPELSSKARGQFESLAENDWVRFDLPDTVWPNEYLVVGFETRNNQLRLVQFGFDGIRGTGNAARTEDPVIHKLIVTD